MGFLAPVAIALCCSAVWSVVIMLPQVSERPAALPRPGICQREAVKVVGRAAVRVGKGVPAPRKRRDAKPQYPELPPNTSGSGMWIGEVLLDRQGNVAHVWPLREVQFTPPFPPFNQAIIDAIAKWEFVPVIVHGDAT